MVVDLVALCRQRTRFLRACFLTPFPFALMHFFFAALALATGAPDAVAAPIQIMQAAAERMRASRSLGVQEIAITDRIGR